MTNDQNDVRYVDVTQGTHQPWVTTMVSELRKKCARRTTIGHSCAFSREDGEKVT
jgi:hypothetical protein